jgi:protein-S-isoprenylcysteine O-methyltransferase Ste14
MPLFRCGGIAANLISVAGKLMIGPNIALTVIVGAVIAALVHFFPPLRWGPMQTVGACLLAVSFVLWTLARFQLGKSLTVTPQARALVTRGLYSKIRNPIYVFASCVIVGVIFVLGRPIWLLLFVVVIPLQLWQSRKEAAVLEAKFGEDYRKYREGTWF